MVVPAAEAQHRPGRPLPPLRAPPCKLVVRRPSAPSATQSSLSRRRELASACGSPLTRLRPAPRPRHCVRPINGGSRCLAPPPPHPAPGRRGAAVWLSAWPGAGANGVEGRPGSRAVTGRRHGPGRLTSALALYTHTAQASGDQRGSRRQSAGVPSGSCWVWLQPTLHDSRALLHRGNPQMPRCSP